MRLSAAGQVSLGVLLAVLCAIVAVLQPGAVGLGAGFDATAWRLGAYFYLPAAVFWLLLVPVWLQRRWPLANPVLALATGMVLLLPVWLALIQCGWR